MNLFVDGGGQLRIFCTPGMPFSVLTIVTGDYSRSEPLHERITPPWNCSCGTVKFKVAIFVYLEQ